MLTRRAVVQHVHDFGYCVIARYGATAPGTFGSALTSRPHVTQKCHPASTSLLQAGHCAMMTFKPQCGQKDTARPDGSAFVQ